MKQHLISPRDWTIFLLTLLPLAGMAASMIFWKGTRNLDSLTSIFIMFPCFLAVLVFIPLIGVLTRNFRAAVIATCCFTATACIELYLIACIYDLVFFAYQIILVWMVEAAILLIVRGRKRNHS